MAQDDQINIKIGVTGAEESRGQITSLGDAFTALHGGLLTGVGAFQSWVVTANQAIGLVQQLIGGFEMLLRPVEDVGQALINVGEQLNNIVGMTDAVTQTLGQAFAQSAFALNEQTERNFFNWAYLYGGPAQGGVPIASELARWSQKASLSMPFTRQDLMSAITTLAVMPGMTPSAEEKDLALLSDVASTQGRPGLTLQWAAMAALRGGEGYGRMLLMDLNLSEATMKKYGYDKSNPATFFPALQAYEAARQGGHYTPGSIGEAISTETFWGAQTSFVDRIQNTLLQLGGWNNNATTLTGDVRQGSVFGILKQDLVDVSNWMDTHSQQLQQLADVAGRFFGGVTGAGGSIFGSFFEALSSSGIGDMILGAMHDFVSFLAQPDTQAALKNLGDLIGNIAGSGGKDLVGALQGIFQGLSGSNAAGTFYQDLKNIGNWFADPTHQMEIKLVGELMGLWLGDLFISLSASADLLMTTLGNLGIVLKDFWQILADEASGNISAVGTDLVQLSVDLHNANTDISQEWQQMQQALGKSAFDIFGDSSYALTSGAASGTASGASRSGLQFLHQHRGHIIPAALGIASSQASAQGQVAAQDFATGYITKAQTLMAQQQTTDAIVQPFVTSLQRSITAGSDLLATTLLHVIQQETQKQIAGALASRDLLGNLSGRAPGGQRFGASIGF